jgi:hypothetical protein
VSPLGSSVISGVPSEGSTPVIPASGIASFTSLPVVYLTATIYSTQSANSTIAISATGTGAAITSATAFQGTAARVGAGSSAFALVFIIGMGLFLWLICNLEVGVMLQWGEGSYFKGSGFNLGVYKYIIY